MRVVGRYTDWTDGMDPVFRIDIHIIIINGVGGGGNYSYMSSVQLSDRSLLPVWM